MKGSRKTDCPGGRSENGSKEREKRMGKIIFLDVDGTLVDYENRLPASAVRAIRQARNSGHRVYICTGRSRAEVYPQLWEIGLDGMIGGNGSYVEDHGHVVMHRLITLEQCTVRSVFPDMIFDGKLYRDDLNKVSFLLSDYQDYVDAKAAFPDLKAGTWGGKDEEALFGDLGVKDIDKAVAVEALLSYIHGNREDTIAFGDAKVDLPMLECCALGVAMGNGGPEIRAAADYVTAPVDQDGLYQAFEALGLLGQL